MSKVLVTGGSGFLGCHTILQLLRAGHTVRTTVRDPRREPDVRAMLKTGGLDADDDRLSFAIADLSQDDGWMQAVRDCEYVLHVASPFPAVAPRDEAEIVGPARDGALRVLRAARDAGCRRVVLTSSFGAIAYGHPARTEPFTEADWTRLDGSDVSAYIRSKTLAERAAWDFIADEGGALELAVINPVGIFGPALGPDYASSLGLVKALLDGAMPATPRIHFGVVDVRDVADLHLRAMTHPQAAGERFIAAAGPALSLHDVARILRERLGPAAHKVPRRSLPDWLARTLGHFSPAMRGMVPQLGIVRNPSADKARRMLDWSPLTAAEAIAASGASLQRLNLPGRR